MTTRYTPVIGLEVHAELQTKTKMFCGCPVVDTITAAPNSSVCPVCSGMPGALPVINREAVTLGLRVALAMNCQVAPYSLFARKNYFYPDLPKGFQISQYEFPLATGGGLTINTSTGDEFIQLRRIHLEEDTGKLTHYHENNDNFSLVDLNRAGIGLLEIVTEPVLTSLEAVRAYSTSLRAILRYLSVCSGDMEKGAIRFEANLSLKAENHRELGTRVEIKNLNSFRAMERAIKYEIERQTNILSAGGKIHQETLGWDEPSQQTISQRSKEEAHDYRYFPEPDLPPLTIGEDWLNTVRASLPELPSTKKSHYIESLKLSAYQAGLVCNDLEVAEFFENAIRHTSGITPRQIANWLTGDIFAYLNQSEHSISDISITPESLVYIIEQVETGIISRANGRQVLLEALSAGQQPDQIIKKHGFGMMSDESELKSMLNVLISKHPGEVEAYRGGKVTVLEWFLGQAMRETRGKADPALLRELLLKLLGKPIQNNQ